MQNNEQLESLESLLYIQLQRVIDYLEAILTEVGGESLKSKHSIGSIDVPLPCILVDKEDDQGVYFE